MPIETSLVIKDFNMLFEAAEMAKGRFKESPFFRGQVTTGERDKQWKLLPEVLRNQSGDDRVPRQYGRQREITLFLSFCAGAHSRYPSVPDVTDYARWMSLMQHHGLPTRLLDWTGSILVAAFFAVCDGMAPCAGPPVIWALGPGRLNSVQGISNGRGFFRTDNTSISSVLNLLLQNKKFEQERIFAVVGEEIALKMMVQQSCFTFHESEAPLEEFHGSDGKINPEDFLMKFEIYRDFDTEWRFRKSLDAAGIRESTLFPDLDRLASDLKERYMP